MHNMYDKTVKNWVYVSAFKKVCSCVVDLSIASQMKNPTICVQILAVSLCKVNSDFMQSQAV